MFLPVSNNQPSMIAQALPLRRKDEHLWFKVSSIFAGCGSLVIASTLNFSASAAVLTVSGSMLVAAVAFVIFKFGIEGLSLFRAALPLMRNYFPSEIFSMMQLIKKVPPNERNEFVGCGWLIDNRKKGNYKNELLELLLLIPAAERNECLILALALALADDHRIDWYLQVLCHVPARERKDFAAALVRLKISTNTLPSLLAIPSSEVLEFLYCATPIIESVDEKLVSVPLELLRECPVALRKSFAVALAHYFKFDRERLLPVNDKFQYIQSWAKLAAYFDPIFHQKIDQLISNLPADERLPFVDAAESLFEIEKPRWSIVKRLRKIDAKIRSKCASEIVNISELSWAAPFLEQIDHYSVKDRLEYYVFLYEISENERVAFMNYVQGYLATDPDAIQNKDSLLNTVTEWKNK